MIIYFKVGQSQLSSDCKTVQSCSEPGGKIITSTQKCDPNATCSLTAQNSYACVCGSDYYGDGLTCNISKYIFNCL